MFNVLKAIKENGGVTIDVDTWKPVTPDKGFAVATEGENMGLETFEKVYCKTMLDLDRYVQAFRRKHGKPEYVGFWLDNGVVYIDAVLIVDSLISAISQARVHAQRAIYSFEAQTSLYINA
jgi:hypothetical protein